MLELILLGVSLFLVFACGLFVMAEFAIITVNRSKIEKLVQKDDPKAKSVLHAITTLSTQLSSAQVGITITNLAIGFLAEPAIAYYVRGPLTAVGIPEEFVPGIAITIGIAIATAFTMVFGELVPKNLAIAKPVTYSKLVIRWLLLFTSIMRVPIHVLNGTANIILRRLGIEPQEELASARSADELMSLVKRSAKTGTLAKETATILERSLSFGDQTALDIMTPRVRVHAIQSDTSVEQALKLAKETGISRFPVYEKNIDNIVGIMHIKYAFGMPVVRRKHVSVRQVMKPPTLVPSSIELEPLLEALRHGGLQIAIVIDEFGGTDGIVTMEDVLEELVGEVRDEHDYTTPHIQKRTNDSWLLSGLLRPDEIADQLGLMLPDEEEVETVGGLIAHILERIPAPGDAVTVKSVDREGNTYHVTLTVKKMDANRVDRILLSFSSLDKNGSKERRS